MNKKSTQNFGFAPCVITALFLAVMLIGCEVESGNDALASRSLTLSRGLGEDPTTWTPVAGATGTTSNINGVANTPNMGTLVVTGGTGAVPWVAYSTNSGSTWNPAATPPTTIGRYLSTAAYANGYFYTSTGGGSGLAAYSAYSHDGSNWTAISNDATTGISFGNKGFVYNGTNYLVSGQNGQIAFSADMVNWNTLGSAATTFTDTSTGTQSDRYINVLAYDGTSTIVAAGAHGHTAYSTDGGHTWSVTAPDVTVTSREATEVYFDPTPTVTPFGWINGLAYGAGVFVAVGGAGGDGLSMYSSNGINWTRGGNLGTSSTIMSVAYGIDYFVATADDGSIYYSTDGISWTQEVVTNPFAGGTIACVSFAATTDVFVIAGANGSVAISD